VEDGQTLLLPVMLQEGGEKTVTEIAAGTGLLQPAPFAWIFTK
jgi:hypothetical protein